MAHSTTSFKLISTAGIKRLEELFMGHDLPVPRTLHRWPLQYARDVAEILVNYETLFEVNPLQDRLHLMETIHKLGVYGQLEDMR